jgi:hypothetical protein
MNKQFKNVIIWGHPLGSHTHSFIHGSFYKAFRSMGFNTIWTNNPKDLEGIELDSSLFVTEGQVDQNIPLVKGSHYVIHNCNDRKYIEAGCKVLVIQVIHSKTYGITERNEVINKYTILEKNDDVNCLYMCWATDLLPEEIDLNTAKNNLTGDCVWVGTSGGGNSTFENWSNLNPFFDSCNRSGINVNQINPWSNPISYEKNMMLVNNSYISPTIQGKWQISVGYIPCRIFKNISYGHFGYTNSSSVNDIFDGRLVYSSDSEELFNLSIDKKKSDNHIKDLRELMNEVKQKHTYVNRINQIIDLLP